MTAANEKQTKDRDARMALALEVLRDGPITNAELGERLGMNRATASKYTVALAGLRLVTRQLLPIPGGGFVYGYTAVPGAVYSPPRREDGDFLLPDAFMRAMVAYGKESRI